MIKHYYKWTEYAKDVKALYENLSRTYFDCILSIYRGGLILGTNLSNIFNKPLEIAFVQTRDGSKIQIPNLDQYKNILIAEDIIDSGKTLEILVKNISNQNKEIKCSCLFCYDDIEDKFNFPIFTRYILKRKRPIWIVFPWETI